MRTSDLRKLYHFVGGLFFPCLYLFWDSREWIIAVCGGLLLLSLVLEWVRFDFPKINRWLADKFWFLLKSKERHTLTGHTYLLAATLAVVTLFEKNIAILALAFVALGDSSASVIGMKFGRRRVFSKSFEGTAACFVTCLLLGFGYQLMGPAIGWKLILVGAVTTSVVELIPLPFDDNFSIPLSAAFMMSLVV